MVCDSDCFFKIFFQKRLAFFWSELTYTYMTSKQDLKKLLERFLNGTATKEEKGWVEQWYASLEGEHDYPTLDDENQRMLDEIDLRMIRRRIHPKHRVLPLWKPLAAAAAVLIIGIAFVYLYTPDKPDPLNGKEFSFFKNREHIINESSSIKIVKLPDSSKVSLQPNSSLSIAFDFNDNERKVFLEGEAFFDVAHNPEKPFFVYAQTVVTKVLGTSFSVKALSNDKDIVVAVKTGKVSVYKRKDILDIFRDPPASVVLTANHQAIYNAEKDQIDHTLVSDPKIIISREEEERIVKFNAAPIKEIFTALEKMYGVQIEYDQQVFRDRSLTITISSQSLFDRIDSICEAIGAEYTIDDGTIKIKKLEPVQNQ